MLHTHFFSLYISLPKTISTVMMTALMAIPLTLTLNTDYE